MIYNDIRRTTREISVGNVKIGGQNKIAIQSMTNTDTKDAGATIEQIKRLASAGLLLYNNNAKNVSVIKIASVRLFFMQTARAGEGGENPSQQSLPCDKIKSGNLP